MAKLGGISSKDINLVLNPTHGKLVDIDECCLGRRGEITGPVASLLVAWDTFFKNNEKGDLLHICHSQGAIHTKQALQHMPEEYKQRMNVVSFAGGAIIEKHEARETMNYIVIGDPIPRLSKLVWQKNPNANIERLNPIKNQSKHSFRSEVYKKAIENTIEKHVNQGQ
jgi:hypothetical protein